LDTREVIEQISAQTGFTKEKSAILLGAILGNIIKGTADTGVCKIGICKFTKLYRNFKNKKRFINPHGGKRLYVTNYAVRTRFSPTVRRMFKSLSKVMYE
jgi:nucleoid DNA-binding protein